MAFWTQWTAKAKGATWSRICKLTNDSYVGVLFLISIAHTRNSVCYNSLFSVTLHMSSGGKIVLLSNHTFSSNIQLRIVRPESTGADVYVDIYDSNLSITNETEISVACSILIFKGSKSELYTTYTAGEVPSGALYCSMNVTGNDKYDLIADKIKGLLIGNANTATLANNSTKFDGYRIDENMIYQSTFTLSDTGYNNQNACYFTIYTSDFFNRMLIRLIGYRNGREIARILITQYQNGGLYINSKSSATLTLYYNDFSGTLILSCPNFNYTTGSVIKQALQYCACSVQTYSSGASITFTRGTSTFTGFSSVLIPMGNHNILTSSINASSFIKIGGTSSLFLKADGSVDSTTYATKALLDNLALNSGSGTVTSVTTGVGLTGGPITATGTIKASLKSETASSLTATAMGSTTNRQYAVGVDANGHLSVNIPWIDNSDLLDGYVSISGDESITGTKTFNKPIVINTGTTNNSYNEGLRITRAGNSWAGITFGSTGASGAPTGGWFAATNPSNQFIINPDDSSNTNGLCLNKNGDAKWRNNTILHYGNYTSYVYSQSLSDDRYVNVTGDTMSGKIIFDQTATTRDVGVIGTYDPLKAAAIWSMGSAYSIKNDGTTLGNLYGAAYVYFGNGYTFGAGYSGGHSFVWTQSGTIYAALGNYVWSRGGFIKKDSSDSYVLLGGGGHKAVSDFLPLVTHSSMSTEIPSDLVPGIHVIHRPNVEYSSILAVKDYNGQFALLYFHPTAAYTDRIYYRKGSASWYTLAYTSDIPTKTSQLTNDSGYLTSHLSLANYLPLSGGWMTWNSQIYFKGKDNSTSVYSTIGYRTSASNKAMHCINNGNHQTDGAFYITSNGSTSANDTGGIAIDNEGVTVFGAGDAGSNFTGVFRVLNEDNVDDGPQFFVTKNSGATTKYSHTAQRFISNVETGTLPYACTSTTLNTNLNADLLDGQHGSYYATASSLNNYLPLSGGTITNTNAEVPLKIVGKNDYSCIMFKGNNGHYRTFGIKGTNADLFVSNADGWSNEYAILHSGNAYISNGSITINGTSITPLTSHQSLSNYVTLNGDLTITGTKTFNVGKWKLAGNENNEIYNIHFANGTYYKYDNSAVLGSGYGLKNSLVFRWFNDYWAIGNIRSGGVDTLGFGISLLSSDGAHLLDRFRVSKDGTGYLNGNQIITTANIGSYTGIRIADAQGAGGAPITTSVNNSAVTSSYYILATTSSGSCGWYLLPSNAFYNSTYSAGTGMSLDGSTFNVKLATNTQLGITKYVKYYSSASVKRYNGDVGGSEVDTSTTANIDLSYASSTSGRFYPVLVDKNGFPFVNIPWSDTTYTFTTSGSGNVLTGLSVSGTTVTFSKGSVSSGSSYSVASTSSSGLAPQLSLDSTNTISSQSTDYVLTYKSGTNTTPVWRKLPTNAFLNDNSWRPVYVGSTSIYSEDLILKSGTGISLLNNSGEVTISASAQFLVVSSLPSGSSITSGVLYLVTT